MLFNPTKVVEGKSVLKIFPELSKHKIFRTSPGPEIDNNLVLLFIMCIYDKGTPYRGKYSDVLKRKAEVANDVGFKHDEEGNFETPIEDMLKGNNEVVNRKIVEYVRIHRNIKYTYFVAMEQAYYDLMLESLSDPKAKSMEKFKEMQIELEDTMSDLLNDDENPYLKDRVLRYIAEVRLGLRPEDIAKKIKNGETPVKLIK
jgi:hypothetical protein